VLLVLALYQAFFAFGNSRRETAHAVLHFGTGKSELQLSGFSRIGFLQVSPYLFGKGRIDSFTTVIRCSSRVLLPTCCIDHVLHAFVFLSLSCICHTVMRARNSWLKLFCSAAAEDARYCRFCCWSAATGLLLNLCSRAELLPGCCYFRLQYWDARAHVKPHARQTISVLNAIVWAACCQCCLSVNCMDCFQKPFGKHVWGAG
jgi:hypothetical protein